MWPYLSHVLLQGVQFAKKNYSKSHSHALHLRPPPQTLGFILFGFLIGSNWDEQQHNLFS